MAIIRIQNEKETEDKQTERDADSAIEGLRIFFIFLSVCLVSVENIDPQPLAKC